MLSGLSNEDAFKAFFLKTNVMIKWKKQFVISIEPDWQCSNISNEMTERPGFNALHKGTSHHSHTAAWFGFAQSARVKRKVQETLSPSQHLAKGLRKSTFMLLKCSLAIVKAAQLRSFSVTKFSITQLRDFIHTVHAMHMPSTKENPTLSTCTVAQVLVTETWSTKLEFWF